MLRGLLAAAAVTTLLLPGDASASPRLDGLRAHASALRAEVDRLTIAAEQASEDYNTVSGELDDLAVRRVLAEQRHDDLRRAADAQRTEVAGHVRELYQQGGDASFLAVLLTADRPGTLLTRSRMADAVLHQDAGAVRAANALASDAARAAADLQALDKRQHRLEDLLAARAAEVRALLAGSGHLLSSADTDVRRVAEQERAAAEVAAAHTFAARVAAAKAAAGGGRTSSSARSFTLPGSVRAPTGAAATAIAAARTRLGLPYEWGAEGPDSFDCSGLTMWSYARAGVALPRTSRQQWYAGPHVALGSLEPGDLLFWATDTSDPASIHHVALYVGSNLMIAAPHTGDVVKVQPVYWSGYIGAVRPTQ